MLFSVSRPLVEGLGEANIEERAGVIEAFHYSTRPLHLETQ